VSTVLYAVQRMAMLSATFVLLGLLCFWHGRTALESHRERRGWLLLFVAVPACTLLGAAAKENGLLLPLLCAVLEGIYFRPAPGERRPTVARAFVWLGVVLPIAIGMLALAWNPQRLLGGYIDRPFDISERLLTEGRVLWDYVASLLLPWGPRLSLYRDDYLISTGLLTPTSTLIALLGWLTLIVGTYRMRRRLPAVAAGTGIFLVGHSMESTIVPLLIYFEHRNYLPAIGILWAAGGLLIYFGQMLAPRMQHPRVVFGAAAVLSILAFALATNARAWIWSDKETLLESALHASPNSRWLRLDMALTALQHSPPEPTIARQNYAVLESMADPVSRQLGAQGEVLVDCLIQGSTTASHVKGMFIAEGRPIESDQYVVLELLANLIMEKPCRGLPAEDFARRLARWLDTASTSERNRVKVNSRYLASRLLLVGGNSREALAQSETSWHAGARDLPLAALIIGLQIQLDQKGQARRTLETIEPTIPADDLRAVEIFKNYRRDLDESSRNGKFLN
jgi:hypothetical protein